MDVHGCKASSAQLVVGDVYYRPDGRVSRILLAPAGTPPCRAAATELFMLTLSRESRPAPVDVSETLVAYFDPEVVSCIDEPPTPATPSTVDPTPDEAPESMARVGTKIQPPKRIRNRNPVYPPSEQNARREGLVILDSVISTSGCLRGARVVRSVSPDLDLAAMVAVLGWKYTPALLNGKPVPVIMTVSVNFSLRP